MAIYSSGQTVLSFPHKEGIILGAGKEAEEIAGDQVAWVWIG